MAEQLSAVNALAESWAEINGKLTEYEECSKAEDYVREGELGGYCSGYRADAELMIDRLAKRGFQIAPTWQPMDTVPKDGTVIIAHDPEYGDDFVHMVYWSIALEKWTDGITPNHFDPTHWVPLPPGPEESE